MADVKLEHVYKVYDNGITAVNDFCLDIKDKEFIVFVGPSGCGKSTTLRMIAGLEKITAGEISIDNTKINKMEPRDRDIAMVFQNYALYPHMTVYNNMALSLKLRFVPGVYQEKVKNPDTGEIEIVEKPILRKMSRKEIKEVVVNAARLLEIEELLDRKPKALSGGQRQRVAIGRAIVRNPKVFLMDEPLSNLDAKLRNQMRAELILLRKKLNTTFIYVTHDQTEAMTLADRIVIMKDGFIQQIGSPQDLFNRPNNLFVATFIGSPQMNLMDGILTDDYNIIIGENIVELSDAKKEELRQRNILSQDIIVGVRPENVEICKQDDPNALSGEIKVIEMMGSTIHAHIETSFGANIVAVISITNLPQEELDKIAVGETIYFNWQSRLVHLFSKETEMNLLPIIKVEEEVKTEE